MNAECGCFTCLMDRQEGMVRIVGMTFMQRMILCPDCGNKRCPHATHHAQACTGSNDTGQEGSRYA